MVNSEKLFVILLLLLAGAVAVFVVMSEKSESTTEGDGSDGEGDGSDVGDYYPYIPRSVPVPDHVENSVFMRYPLTVDDVESTDNLRFYTELLIDTGDLTINECQIRVNQHAYASSLDAGTDYWSVQIYNGGFIIQFKRGDNIGIEARYSNQYVHIATHPDLVDINGTKGEFLIKIYYTYRDNSFHVAINDVHVQVATFTANPMPDLEFHHSVFDVQSNVALNRVFAAQYGPSGHDATANEYITVEHA